MELESLIDKLCYWSFSESYFKFVKDEQHWITKRILIKVDGDKKITDATNIAIRMYYKDPETMGKPYYEAIGKVFKVNPSSL